MTGAGNQKTAVVLSGGGANGAYEVGVMRALLGGASPVCGGAPLDPEVYTGTSVGAYNAAFMTSQPGTPAGATIDRLDQIWRHRIAAGRDGRPNGVMRLRLDPRNLARIRDRPLESLALVAENATFLTSYGLTRGLNLLLSRTPFPERLTELVDISSFVSSAPMGSLIHDTIDLAGIAASRKELWIAASNWQAGKVRTFTNEEVARLGHQILRASAAIPGIFPPERVEGVPFVDGGLLLNTPLAPAMWAGADVIHVVVLIPDHERTQEEALPNTASTLYRMSLITEEFKIKLALQRVEVLNEACRLVGAQERATPGYRQGIEKILGFAATHSGLFDGAQPPEFKELGRGAGPFTVHFYRRRVGVDDVPGWLDFSADWIEKLIDDGYQDAVGHDCDESGCVLPHRDPHGRGAS